MVNDTGAKERSRVPLTPSSSTSIMPPLEGPLEKVAADAARDESYVAPV